jgi:cell division protein FtsB
MFDFHQKRKLRTILNSPFTRGALVLLVILIGWSAFTRYEIAKDMEHRRREVEEEVVRLQAQKSALEAEVQYLKDERGIEAEMRRQYDVALPNEQVVVIVEPEKTETNNGSSTYEESEEPAWYEFWR